MENDVSPGKLNVLLARILVALAVCVFVTAAVVAYLWLRPVGAARPAQELAYVGGSDTTNLDVFLTDSSGRRTKALTTTQEDELYPAWSPDGKSLAFVRTSVASAFGGVRPPASAGIYLLMLDGDKPREELLARAQDLGIGAPVWSPDGRRIAMLTVSMPPEGIGAVGSALTIINVAAKTHETIPLTPTVTGSLSALLSWSPDGTAVSFSATRGVLNLERRGDRLPEDIPSAGYVYRFATRTLAMVAPEANSIAWSPTGELLASTDTFGAKLNVVRPDGTGARTLLENAAAQDVVWSPDGKRLAASVWMGEHEGSQVLILSIDNDSRTALAVEGEDRGAYWLSWSRDGAYLAYTALAPSETFPEGGLWIVDAQRGTSFALPDPPGLETMAVWRPTSR